VHTYSQWCCGRYLSPLCKTGTGSEAAWAGRSSVVVHHQVPYSFIQFIQHQPIQFIQSIQFARHVHALHWWRRRSCCLRWRSGRTASNSKAGSTSEVTGRLSAAHFNVDVDTISSIDAPLVTVLRPTSSSSSILPLGIQYTAPLATGEVSANIGVPEPLISRSSTTIIDGCRHCDFAVGSATMPRPQRPWAPQQTVGSGFHRRAVCDQPAKGKSLAQQQHPEREHPRTRRQAIVQK